MNSKEYRLVNWEKGMEVSSNNLRQLEDFFIDRIRDTCAMQLTNYNYGILPILDRKTDSTEFDISERVTGKVEIRLRRCNALTLGGCRISYNPKQGEYIHYIHTFEEDINGENKEIQTHYWDVILTVDPFQRIPIGIPDIEEIPLRHPDVTENYKLSIIPHGQTNYEQLGMFHLVIGRIRQHSGRYEVDTNYIPPCTSVNSHFDLLQYYERFGMYMSDIERASKIIIGKIRNRLKNYPIAEHICRVCENMMNYIATIYFPYRNMGRESAPIELVNYFSTLAHICYVSTNTINKSEREEMFKYFYEWSDVTPGTLEEILSDTLSIIYNHNSIRPVMLQVETFLRTISELWLKLSTLEYIGQHKENIVVSERVHQTQSKARGGWTTID